MKGVSTVEIEQIQQAFQDIKQKAEDLEAEMLPDIELLYIVVNKKTNVEIYAQGEYEEDSYKNAVPGTVLDCHNGLQQPSKGPVEFYLVS